MTEPQITKRTDRINLLRTLLIFGIVALHIAPSIQFPAQEIYASNTLVWLKILIEKTFFRAAVPTLSVISGYLFYQKYSKRGYVKCLRNKVKSLLVPLLLWNVPLVLLLFILQSQGYLLHSFRLELYPFNVTEWLNACIGLEQSPINFPLAFIRDLFACVLIAPLYYLFLSRAPFLGLILLITIVVLKVPNPIILRPSIMIGFYLGAMICLSGWSLRFVDKFNYLFMLAFLSLSLCVSFLGYSQIYSIDAYGLGQWMNVLRLSGVLAFWALSGLLVRLPIGQYLASISSVTFFVFCIHGPLMVFSWIVFKGLVGDTSSQLYAIYYLLIAPVIIVFSVMIAKLLNLMIPRVYVILTGRSLRVSTQMLNKHTVKA
jgi:Acyltransferase family